MLIKFEKHLLPNRFYVVERSPKHPEVDDRDKEGYYIQLGAIFTLVFLIFVAFIFQQREKKEVIPFVPTDLVLSVVEDIPETKHSQNIPPPPRMPVVPVESEEIEEMLEEIVFEIESLSFVKLPGAPTFGFSIPGVSVSPRPTVEVFPDYPDSEKKKGYEGTIDLEILVDVKGNVAEVKVIRNTTGSKRLEKEAIKAALGCKFQPARDENKKPIAVRTKKSYSFKIK